MRRCGWDARGTSQVTFPLPIAFLPASNTTFFSPTRPGRPAARRGPAVLSRFAHPAEAYRWTRWTRGIEYRQIGPSRRPISLLMADFWGSVEKPAIWTPKWVPRGALEVQKSSSEGPRGSQQARKEPRKGQNEPKKGARPLQSAP